MNISELIALVQEIECEARIKLKNHSEPENWSWVIEPVAGYIESGGGPWSFRDVEWIEINPVVIEHIGRLVAPKKTNK